MLEEENFKTPNLIKSKIATLFTSKKLQVFRDKKRVLFAISTVFVLVMLFLVIWLMLDKGLNRLGQKEISEDEQVNQEEKDEESLFGQLLDETSDVENEELPISIPFFEPTPTPVITGSVSGETRVGYYSRPMAGIEVTATGENFSKITKTEENGNYSLDQLPIGYYTISFYHPDYRFGNAKIQVNQGVNSVTGSALGGLKNPQPLTISTNTFSDSNANGSRDSGEEILRPTIRIYKKSGSDWQIYSWFSSDTQGNYSSSIIESGEYKIEPTSYTYHNPPSSQFFTVDGYGGSKSFSFVYTPIVSQGGMIIYVFNDKNENSTKDAGEEYIHYQYARVTHADTGTSNNLGVGESGMEYLHLEYGLYNLQLIPESSSWDSYYKITKGNASVNITSAGGQQKVELGAHKLY